MKLFFLISISLLAPYLCLSQKTGYKEISLGSNIQSIINLDKYKLYKVKELQNTYDIPGENSLAFCNSIIDDIVIQTDENKIITEIKLYSKKVRFANYDDWWSMVKSTLTCMVNTVGKLDYSNLNEHPREKINCMWVFPETQTSLTFLIDDNKSINATDYDSNYLIIWQNQVSKPNKMW